MGALGAGLAMLLLIAVIRPTWVGKWLGEIEAARRAEIRRLEEQEPHHG